MKRAALDVPTAGSDGQAHESPAELGYPTLSASPKRGLLVAISVFATAVGALPALVILDIELFVSAFVAIGLVASILSLRRVKTTRTVPPSPGEFALAAVGAVFPTLLTSLAWLAAYYAAKWLIDALGIGSDAGELALYATAPVALGLAIVYAVVNVDNVVAQLYPDTAGARSAYYEAVQDARVALVLAVVSLVIVVTVLLLPISSDVRAWILLVYGLVVTSLAYEPNSDTTPGAELNDVESLSDLLGMHDVKAEPAPRSDNLALDPYLGDIDVLARKDAVSYAISLVRGESGRPVRWTEAANLRLAARALGKELPDRQFVPLLIVVADKVDERLAAYCEAHRVALVQITSDGPHVDDLDSAGWMHEVEWEALTGAKRRPKGRQWP